MTFIGILGQRLENRRLIARRQRRDDWRGLQMLKNQLANVIADEWPLAREQFLVDDGEAVLIAVSANPAVERFRSGVDRRDAPGDGGGHALQILDQPEVGDLDVIVNKEDVLGLDIEMLQLV